MGAKTTRAESKESAERAGIQPHSSPVERAPGSRDITSFLFGLQRLHGNRYVQRLLSSGVLQAKLTVSEPGDQYEQEADRVAEQVMRMPEPHGSWRANSDGEAKHPQIQRMCSACDEEELHRRSNEKEESAPEVSPEAQSHIATLNGGGEPLPARVRAFFEPRFGHDFSQVRIHRGARASETAQALNARAFTLQRHIVLGTGQYEPNTNAGRRLLAHELTHVVQQGADGGGLQQIARQPTEEEEEEMP
jgi:hypothetical protein